MFKVEVIGNIGADAEIKNANGASFVTFRVAHNDRYTNANGQEVDETLWVDCTFNNVQSGVVQYLKAGARVFVRGNGKSRLYSSPKLKRMVAGIQCSVQEIELVGSGQRDEVPQKLYDTNGVEHLTQKYFWTESIRSTTLMDIRGRLFQVNQDGYIIPAPTAEDEVTTKQAENTTTEKSTDNATISKSSKNRK